MALLIVDSMQRRQWTTIGPHCGVEGERREREREGRGEKKGRERERGEKRSMEVNGMS